MFRVQRREVCDMFRVRVTFRGEGGCFVICFVFRGEGV